MAVAEHAEFFQTFRRAIRNRRSIVTRACANCVNVKRYILIDREKRIRRDERRGIRTTIDYTYLIVPNVSKYRRYQSV